MSAHKVCAAAGCRKQEEDNKRQINKATRLAAKKKLIERQEEGGGEVGVGALSFVLLRAPQDRWRRLSR
jgi:hypothetical protein